MSGTAGWTGLVSGTLAAIAVDVLVRTEVLQLSSQAGSFVGASAAFVVGIAVSGAVTMVTTSKPDAELVGLVWQLTPKETRQHETTGEDAGWFRSPALLGGLVLALTFVLYLLVP
jgi:SSS family solute:Na+ symporter